MNKKFLIIIPILSILVLNFSLPVFATDTGSKTNNTTSFSDDLKEPEVGDTTCDDMTNSYYIWDKLTVEYTWHNNQWSRFIGIEAEDNNYLYRSLFDFDPYVMKNLPIVGKEGQCITYHYWMYLGQGLRPEKIFSKLTELESKINTENK